MIWVGDVKSDEPCPLCGADPKLHDENRFDNCAVWECGTKVWGHHWTEDWDRIDPTLQCVVRRVSSLEDHVRELEDDTEV